MKLFPRVAGALLVPVGMVWFLQGIDVLPGSSMTGQVRWAVYGAIAASVGGALLYFARGRR